MLVSNQFNWERDSSFWHVLTAAHSTRVGRRSEREIEIEISTVGYLYCVHTVYVWKWDDRDLDTGSFKENKTATANI